MIFASTPPRNTDPKAYRCVLCSDRFARDQRGVNPHDTVWAPRPHFDRPRAHEANPILLAVRESDLVVESWVWALRAEAAFGGYIVWEDESHPFHVITTASVEEIEHARRVLERLAGWSE